VSDRIRIFEMSPRDGLQNEKRLIATADKIRLVDLLSEVGFDKIEVTSFVSPKWVPQMADAADVLAGISRRGDVAYTALTPNLMGYQAARMAKADEAAVFASASEGFSQRNINCSIAESLARFEPLMEAAKADGVPVRGYVSCVIACPYDGAVKPEAVADVAAKLLAMGCYEVSLGDTIGVGTPETVDAMLDAVLARIPADKLAGHFHDTNNRAVANVEASIARGLRTFDASAGGLGGCPYAPGAKGNVDTFAVAARARQMGLETRLDFDRLAEAAAFAQKLRA
jgi:hydroxymethylglutaryl-CoA lyase